MRTDFADEHKDYNRFEFAGQAVWAEKDLEAKRDLFIKTMVDKFAYPKKADQFRQKAIKTTNPTVIDKMVGDLILLQSGDKVIR